MKELIVSELRLRAFDGVVPPIPGAPRPVKAGETAVAATPEAAVPERLVARHSRRRETAGELGV